MLSAGMGSLWAEVSRKSFKFFLDVGLTDSERLASCGLSFELKRPFLETETPTPE